LSKNTIFWKCDPRIAVVEKTPEAMPDKSDNAIDALHADLTEKQRKTSELLHDSLHAEAQDAPPMPDGLLDDVLDDLGVKKEAKAGSEVPFFERCLEMFRGRSMALAGLAAAACVVAVLAINLNNGGGGSAVRGEDGGKINEPSLVVFASPTPEQRATAQENFEADHLRFPPVGELVGTARARVVVKTEKVKAYRPGETTAFIEEDAPDDPQELMDLIVELTQEFEIEE
jgi:hypothetical protein